MGIKERVSACFGVRVFVFSYVYCANRRVCACKQLYLHVNAMILPFSSSLRCSVETCHVVAGFDPRDSLSFLVKGERRKNRPYWSQQTQWNCKRQVVTVVAAID